MDYSSNKTMVRKAHEAIEKARRNAQEKARELAEKIIKDVGISADNAEYEKIVAAVLNALD